MTKPPFLSDLVLSLIEDRPGSDVDDLMPNLPDYTRSQVMQALQNLAFTQRARCDRRPGRGRQGGSAPGRYYPINGKADQREPGANAVRCVWDLGAQT